MAGLMAAACRGSEGGAWAKIATPLPTPLPHAGDDSDGGRTFGPADGGRKARRCGVNNHSRRLAIGRVGPPPRKSDPRRLGDGRPASAGRLRDARSLRCRAWGRGATRWARPASIEQAPGDQRYGGTEYHQAHRKQKTGTRSGPSWPGRAPYEQQDGGIGRIFPGGAITAADTRRLLQRLRCLALSRLAICEACMFRPVRAVNASPGRRWHLLSFMLFSDEIDSPKASRVVVLANSRWRNLRRARPEPKFVDTP